MTDSFADHMLPSNLQVNLKIKTNLSSKKKEFDFGVPKIKLNRKDYLEFRKKILNMTSDERKRLGINKSTLWHIKKNLFEGKTPKIYEFFLKIQ